MLVIVLTYKKNNCYKYYDQDNNFLVNSTITLVIIILHALLIYRVCIRASKKFIWNQTWSQIYFLVVLTRKLIMTCGCVCCVYVCLSQFYIIAICVVIYYKKPGGTGKAGNTRRRLECANNFMPGFAYIPRESMQILCKSQSHTGS